MVDEKLIIKKLESVKEKSKEILIKPYMTKYIDQQHFGLIIDEIIKYIMEKKVMKYIIDIDALKDCLDLIPVTSTMDGRTLIDLEIVKKMIDKFPKDEVKEKEVVCR